MQIKLQSQSDGDLAFGSELGSFEKYFYGFPLYLKVIKEQMNKKTHPLNKVIDEFVRSFLFMNRHLLYTDEKKILDNEQGSKDLRS